MFLFLSKLLPLFLYPMGAACLLLIVALGLWWKKSKWTPAAVGAALIVLFLSGNGWFSRGLAVSLEWQNIPKTELPTADAIVILGGATKSQAYPRPDVDLAEASDRVWYGASLYRAGKAPKIIITGGRIAWQGNGSPEAEDVTKLLVRMGVPARDIILESESLNTRDNAVNVQPILQAQNFKTILLVTSALHMPRSMAIFKNLGIKAIAAPTDYRVSRLELDQPTVGAESAILSLIPDDGALNLTTQAIKEYIGILVYRLRGWL
jgi:uncharacterized SAM-binding protein YcdF (DUF218 family)